MIITKNTLLINVATGDYPVNLAQVKKNLPNVSFPQEPTQEQLLAFEYAVVNPTEKATGDVVTEGTPSLLDGVYSQSWVTRAFSEEELQAQLAFRKDELYRKIKTLRTEAFNQGIPHLFPDASTEHIQVRDGDRANIASLRLRAEAYKAASMTGEVLYFRTYENNTKALDVDQAILLSDAAYDGYIQILGISWALKDQVDAALTVATLPVLPETLIS